MSAPVSVRIRAYNVGFGDCLLLTFGYADGERSRHVLVDFGTTKLPKIRAPKNMLQVARQIARDCDGHLDVLVVTHRHADHMSGFGGESGKVITKLNPDLIVQPWTEHPDLDPEADAPVRRSTAAGASSLRLVADLSAMHAIAEDAQTLATRFAATTGVPKHVAAQLGFLGETNVKNLPAIRTLQSMAGEHVYVKYGDVLPVADRLPGVRVDVLGPPTAEDAPAIRGYASNDPNYWSLAKLDVRRQAASTRRTVRAATPIFPHDELATTVSQEARWLRPQVDRMHADELLSLVRDLDGVMNNTSLILTFEVDGVILLFPGDAQLENWSWALVDAPDAKANVRRLSKTRLYKVGHHGSLNATPRELLWAHFQRRSESSGPGRLITMMSTSRGKHGNEGRGTEVPRERLVEDLKKFSDYVTTQEETTAAEFWRDRTIDLTAAGRREANRRRPAPSRVAPAVVADEGEG